MLVGSELALDRAQIERSNNRKSAIMAKGSLQGYKFIRLILKNIRKRKISGVDVLYATEFNNDKLGGVLDYQLELRGGDIDFEYRPELGQYVYDLVDTERNRNFLASHMEYDFWDIHEAQIIYDVRARYDKMKEEIRAPKKVEKSMAEKFWEEANAASARSVRVARGEVDTEIKPQMQPVADIANAPGAPGYIEKPPKVAVTPKPLTRRTANSVRAGRRPEPQTDERGDAPDSDEDTRSGLEHLVGDVSEGGIGVAKP